MSVMGELHAERATIAGLADGPEREEWRPIQGFNYEVSNIGNVRRVGRKPLVPRVGTNGYLRVSLGAGNDAYIHRLVCAAFHGPAPAKDSHADHIDGSRTNNHERNLRWLSPAANRALRKPKRGVDNHNARLTEPDVREILICARDVSDDHRFAAKFNVSRRTINDVRRRKTWRHVDVF